MIHNQKAQTVHVVVFLFAIFLSLLFVVFRFPVQYAFVFIFASVIFAISFANTHFALVILILSMLLSPELEAGGGVSGRAVMVRVDDIFLFVIFFGWLAKMAVNKEFGLLKVTTLNRPILFYTFICFFSTLLGILQGYLNAKHSFFFLLKYVEYFLLYFMVVNNLRSIKQAKIFIFFILLTCFFACVYAWVQIPGGGRLSAPFEGKAGEPNTFAGYLLLIISLTLGFIVYPETRMKRLALIFFLGFIGLVFILTLSRGGWLAFFPMFLVIIVLSKKYKAQLVTVFVSLILLSPFIFPQKVYKRVNETFAPERSYKMMGKRIDVSESAAARIDAWSTAFQRVQEKPLLGYGIPIGSVVDNQYTRVLSETGLIGFSAFLVLIVMIFRVAWTSYVQASENNFIQGLCLGYLAGLVGLLFHSFSSATFIIIRIMEPFWFLTALVAILPDILAEENAAEAYQHG
ncbi:MAG: O-antigen ligase family protein [Candidatus Omnitrophota bacterium]|jgi:O-antigen ligase